VPEGTVLRSARGLWFGADVISSGGDGDIVQSELTVLMQIPPFIPDAHLSTHMLN
jgi:hypothetical protein